MFIPRLEVYPIRLEDNVRFITNYLDPNRQNTTRPFFEKTILLYPELKDVNDIENGQVRTETIRSAVENRLEDHKEIISARIAYFREKFDSFIYDFIRAQCELFRYEWQEDDPVIRCYVGYIPFYPRSTEDKCFYVSYQDEERVFSGAVHEINHMIFHEKWKQMHPGVNDDENFPHPLWYLEEIIVDPTLNDERVRPYTLFENKAYPQFYVPNAGETESIMKRVRDCYANTSNIEDFLNKAYWIVDDWVKKT